MKKIVLALVALILLGAGSLSGYHLARQHALWEIGDRLGLVPAKDGRIQVHGEGQVEEASLRDVEKSAHVFNDFLQQQMGASLQRPVELYVAGEEASYRAVLEREFSLTAEEAAQVASISGGWSGGSSHVTAINASAGVMSTYGDRYNTTSHELFHQLQHELSHGRDVEESSLFWLEEGTADYVGAAMSEHLGGKPLWKWQSDVKAALARAESTVKPESIQHCSFEMRKKLMGKEYHTYQVADLMTSHLLQRFPEERRLPLLAEYFRALAESEDGEAAFRQVFGMELPTFLEEYRTWWQGFVRQPVVFHYHGARQESSHEQAVRKEMEASQAWLGRNLGSQLRGEYQVVLSPSEADMAKALVKYTEMPQKEAEQMAERSLCIENGGLLVLNAGHLQEAQQRAFSLGLLIMRTYERQMLGSMKETGAAWLMHGAAYLAGVSRQAETSGYAVGDYLRTARENVRGRNLPRAVELQSEADFSRAVEKYGEKEIASLTELAAYELIRTHGWGSFARYLQEMAKTKDGSRAYRNIYGK